ncbi:MAG: hypothetical protein WB812_02675, partial [Woeseiaceae bacterium]
MFAIRRDARIGGPLQIEDLFETQAIPRCRPRFSTPKRAGDQQCRCSAMKYPTCNELCRIRLY